MHYDEQIAEAAEELRTKERLRKGELVSGMTYEDLIDDIEPMDLAHTPEDNIVDLLTKDMDGDYPLMEGLPQLKETTGKPEGARYCYLGEHSVIKKKTAYHPIEIELKALVNCVDNKAFGTASHCCATLLTLVRELDDDFLSNLVTVRAHALSTGKYTVDSYREEIPIELLLDATARHLLKILYIGDIDEESGVHHLGHIAANLIMIDVQLRLYHA